MNAHLWAALRCEKCYRYLTVFSDAEGQATFVYCDNPDCSEHGQRYAAPRIKLERWTHG